MWPSSFYNRLNTNKQKTKKQTKPCNPPLKMSGCKRFEKKKNIIIIIIIIIQAWQPSGQLSSGAMCPPPCFYSYLSHVEPTSSQDELGEKGEGAGGRPRQDATFRQTLSQKSYKSYPRAMPAPWPRLGKYSQFCFFMIVNFFFCSRSMRRRGMRRYRRNWTQPRRCEE